MRATFLEAFFLEAKSPRRGTLLLFAYAFLLFEIEPRRGLSFLRVVVFLTRVAASPSLTIKIPRPGLRAVTILAKPSLRESILFITRRRLKVPSWPNRAFRTFPILFFRVDRSPSKGFLAIFLNPFLRVDRSPRRGFCVPFFWNLLPRLERRPRRGFLAILVIFFLLEDKRPRSGFSVLFFPSLLLF